MLSAHQCSQTSHFVLPDTSLSLYSLKKTKQNKNTIPSVKSTLTLFKIPTFVNFATVLWEIWQILTNSKPERRWWFKIKNTPGTSNTKKILPYYFAFFFLTKEVTSTQKPRSHPPAQLVRAEEKDCLGCSISAVRKGRVQKKSKPFHF